MNEQAWGAVAGLVGAAGILLVLSWLRARRPLKVGARIAPFVPSSGSEAGGGFPLSGSAWRTMWMLVRPAWAARRSRPARPATSTRESRSLQRLTWIVLGGVLGCVGAVTLGSASPIGVLILGFIGGAVGYLALDRHLTLRRRRRRGRIDQQLPTVVELLAFAVAAGESPVAALDRVAKTTSGELCDEVRACVNEVRSGVSVDIALRGMADDVGSASLSRFVDTLLIALERGTPLAEVMRAQAADCRADERRQLLEVAGRKDVLMLVPVVFLILPTVVLVALFPGIQSLRLVVA